jgi:NAD(P)-dependent dehydrogenase (short-subunit alcohol dehydrogenase family)
LRERAAGTTIVPMLAAGKVALVTGGAQGIGRETALLFADEGAAAVVIADVDGDAGAHAVEAVREHGAESVFVHADVSDAAAVEQLVTTCVTSFGRLDCAYNNAGIVGARVRMHEWAVDEFDRVVAVDLRSVFLCLKFEITAMLHQGGGAIVNASSAGGLISTPGFSAYNAAKHGVVGLTRSAAIEYAADGIRVNAVCPGGVETTISRTVERLDDTLSTTNAAVTHPIGRRAMPIEIAEAVVWLCSDRASYVTGCPFSVDGGYVAQ